MAGRVMAEFGAAIPLVAKVPGQTRRWPLSSALCCNCRGGAALRIKMIVTAVLPGSEAPARRMPLLPEVALRHCFPGLTLDMTVAAPAGVTLLFGAPGSGIKQCCGRWRGGSRSTVRL